MFSQVSGPRRRTARSPGNDHAHERTGRDQQARWPARAHPGRWSGRPPGASASADPCRRPWAQRRTRRRSAVTHGPFRGGPRTNVAFPALELGTPRPRARAPVLDRAANSAGPRTELVPPAGSFGVDQPGGRARGTRGTRPRAGPRSRSRDQLRPGPGTSHEAGRFTPRPAPAGRPRGSNSAGDGPRWGRAPLRPTVSNRGPTTHGRPRKMGRRAGQRETRPQDEGTRTPNDDQPAAPAAPSATAPQVTCAADVSSGRWQPGSGPRRLRRPGRRPLPLR